MPLGRLRGAEFFLAGHFVGVHLAASTGVFVAAALVVGFGDDGGDVDGLAGFVEGT